MPERLKRFFLHRGIVLCPRGHGVHAVKGGVVCQGRAFQFEHGPGFGVKRKNGGNVAVFVRLDERAGGVRPFDRGVKSVRPRLQRLDPTRRRGGLAVFGGVYRLVLIVHDKRRLPLSPTGDHGGGIVKGKRPRLGFDALERAGPSVAGGKFARREKLDASGRGAARRLWGDAGGDEGGECGGSVHGVRVAGRGKRAS